MNDKISYSERQLSTLNVEKEIYINGVFTDKDVIIAKFRDKKH